MNVLRLRFIIRNFNSLGSCCWKDHVFQIKVKIDFCFRLVLFCSWQDHFRSLGNFRHNITFQIYIFHGFRNFKLRKLCTAVRKCLFLLQAWNCLIGKIFKYLIYINFRFLSFFRLSKAVLRNIFFFLKNRNFFRFQLRNVLCSFSENDPWAFLPEGLLPLL